MLNERDNPVIPALSAISHAWFVVFSVDKEVEIVAQKLHVGDCVVGAHGFTAKLFTANYHWRFTKVFGFFSSFAWVKQREVGWSDVELRKVLGG